MVQIKDLEGIDLEYCRANTNKRLVNYLIDLVAFYVIMFFLGFLLEIAFPGAIPYNDINPVLDRVVSLLLYAVIMFTIEAAFQGKSLGKLITGTRAINVHGAPPTFIQLLTRNFVRAVPFNALSAFGQPCVPWHDRWSDTYVIDEKLLALQQRKDVFFKELREEKTAVTSDDENS
ncbi:RDD family protein [Nubsella zeaxanthinifaciens]|uniref:RDD family protein n=1 Tax=Nubsella zeaxanthinifaciens TaxID=392412 RepID=UPI003CFC593A